VLIDNSRMPKPDELPEGLRNFAFRQAAGVDTDHFRPHMDRLISSIDQHLVRLQAAAAPARRRPPVRPRRPHALAHLEMIFGIDEHGFFKGGLPTSKLPIRATNSSPPSWTLTILNLRSSIPKGNITGTASQGLEVDSG